MQYCNREVKFCDQSKLKHHETQEKKQLPTHAASYYSCDHSKLKHHKTQEKEQLPTPGASSMKSPGNLLDYLGISAIPKHLETEEQKLSPTPSAPGMDLGEPNETLDTFSLKSLMSKK